MGSHGGGDPLGSGGGGPVRLEAEAAPRFQRQRRSCGALSQRRRAQASAWYEDLTGTRREARGGRSKAKGGGESCGRRGRKKAIPAAPKDQKQIN